MKDKKIMNFLRYYFSLLVIFTFVITIFIAFWGFSSIAKEKEAIEEEEKILLEHGEQALDEYFDETYRDLLYFSDIISHTNINEEVAKERMARIWYHFSKRSVMYDKIRFIDNLGNEIIRIDYDDLKGPFSVPEGVLQNVINDTHFIKTNALEKDTIYLSNIDLSYKDGEIETPYKPIMSFGYQVWSEGKKIGIILFDYKISKALEDLESELKTSNGIIFLTDSSGYYLMHPNEDIKYGNSIEERSTISFANDNPMAWYKIEAQTGAGVQLYNYAGLITRKNSTFESALKLFVKDGIKIDSEKFKLISIVPATGDLYYLTTDNIDIFIGVIGTYSVVYLFLAGILIFITLLIIKSDGSQKQIDYYTNHDTMTDALNRSAGILILEKALLEIKNKDEKGSIWFYDINGLKEVNDVLGEDEGNNLIIKVTEIIKRVIPTQSELIRYRGDEFIVLFKEIDEEGSKLIWQLALKEFEKFNKANEESFKMSVSIAFADLNKNKDSDIISIVENTKSEMEKNKIADKKKKK